MSTKSDISGIADIKILVDAFYVRIAEDELLAPIFNYRLSTHWGPHLKKMYTFWNAALFGVKGYYGSPSSRHLTMEINEIHFEKWLNIFYETVDLHFEGPVSAEAKKKARTMADMFLTKINTLNNAKPIM